MEIKIEGDFQKVAMVCVSLKALCLHFSLPGIVAYQVSLCVDEILNNIIEHEFRFNKNGPILIRVNFQDQRLTVQITYEGQPAPMRRPVTPRFDPGDLDNLPERGHGWLLVNEIMDRVTCERNGEENRLTIVKDIPELSLSGVK